MKNAPSQGFSKLQPNSRNNIRNIAMQHQIMQHSSMINGRQRPLHNPVPHGVKTHDEILRNKALALPQHHLQIGNNRSYLSSNYGPKPNSGGDLLNSSSSFSQNGPNFNPNLSQGLQTNQNRMALTYADRTHHVPLNNGNGFLSHSHQNLQRNIAPHTLNQKHHNQLNYSGHPSMHSTQPHHRPHEIPKFHPSYFLLSKFPLLLPKDQIYLPVINRLQNVQSKHIFHELYVNLKFLLIQPDEQFWKYLGHLHSMAINGLSDEEIKEGYKLRVSLQSCLTNFTVKQFNKCVNMDEVKSSSVAFSKKIYQYESIFNSESFRQYQKLFETVLEFYQRLVKTRNPIQIDIVVGSWYIDTLKSLDIAIIYGNKQPARVKQLIKAMFNLNPKIYTKDFINLLNSLLKYIEISENLNDDADSFSLLHNLNKKIEFLPNKSRISSSKLTFRNPEEYFVRQIFFLCSECLKLFMYVTNVFKLFPSHIKLIFMENLDFIRTLNKISARIMHNLREEQRQKKRKWKISPEIKSQLKEMEFIMMDKITEMYKFIFLNTKNALEQQISDDPQKQKTQVDLKHEKIITTFYKKLIEGTVNRKKDKQNDVSITQTTKKNNNSTTTKNSKDFDSIILKKEKQLKPQQQADENENLCTEKESEPKQNQSDRFSEKSLPKKDDEETKNASEQKSEFKKNQKRKSFSEKQYGRVLLKYLLRKQLKKDSKKYSQTPYFYTKKLYDHFKNNSKSPSTYENQSFISQNSNEKNSSKSPSSNLCIYLMVLEEFEKQVKQEYFAEIELGQKYRKLDLIIRQLPTLAQFERREKALKLRQMMKDLNAYDKEYDDEPTQEEEIEMYWEHLVLDEDDFTKIEEGMFGNQNELSFNFLQKNQIQEISFSGGQMRNTSTTLEWAVSQGNERQNRGKNANFSHGRKGNRLEGDSSEQLSPEEISQFELNQQLLSSSMTGGVDSSKMATLTSINTSIFKPHETMQKVAKSMIKEEMEYFEKIKNLNWHEISRISVKKEEIDPKKRKNHDESSMIKYNDLIKVEDIGLSFDMILGDSEDQEDDNNNNRTIFSHFYYNQWKDERKKKSFMEDYEWSNVIPADSNEQEEEESYDNLMKKKNINGRQQNMMMKMVDKSMMGNGCQVRRDFANYMSSERYDLQRQDMPYYQQPINPYIMNQHTNMVDPQQFYNQNIPITPTLKTNQKLNTSGNYTPFLDQCGRSFKSGR